MAAPRSLLAAVPANELAAAVVGRVRVLARRWGAPVELVACVYDPVLAGGSSADGGAEAGLAEARLGAFRALAQPLDAEGIAVSVHGLWNRPVHEGLLTAIARSQPDLVLAATFRHSLLERLGLTDSDWRLVRHCPVPLLLVRRQPEPDWPAAVVAVDTHPGEPRTLLADRLLEAAADLAPDCPRHLLHCHLPAVRVPLQAPGAVLSGTLGGAVAGLAEGHRRALTALAGRHGIPPEHTHLDPSDPRDGIPDAVARLGAGLLVMGATTRTPLGRLLLGSTAEAVLDQVPADVLLLRTSP